MKIIANYLPQFHNSKHNNLWWGNGFSEWTNIARHERFSKNQELIVPGELGFYDLEDKGIHYKQCELASAYGIDAFMYWVYYTGIETGFLLDKPLDVRLEVNHDLPFCFSWANHDWKKKEWDKNANVFSSEILAKQKYGKEDIRFLYDHYKKWFADKRYFRVSNKLVFGIFKPLEVPYLPEMINSWNCWASEDGLEGFMFIGHSVDRGEIDEILQLGIDLVNFSPLAEIFKVKYTRYQIVKRLVKSAFGFRNMVPYSEAILKSMSDKINTNEFVIPTLIPRWDHTPRSGKHGTALLKPSPHNFFLSCRKLFAQIQKKNQGLVILKSWNEWGEGNFIEPDFINKRGYLEALAKALEDVKE